ncbi:MAG: flagellar assembly protein FliX [Alphaproteobacteria bacterium]|nr:flagellar assembly protein FliX [Alphaproteobacteria bacterium]
MKVSESGASKGVSQARKSSSVSAGKGTEFASVLADTISGADEASGISSPSAVGAVDSVFMIQDVGDATEQEAKKRKAIDRGNNLLDRLEEIRRELLSGAISKQRLIELAQMVRTRKESGVPERLEEIISEIELRVEVELAKLYP